MRGLDPARFNRLLHALRQNVLWRTGTVCPCRNWKSGSGSPKRNCKHCRGKGTFWSSLPVAATTGVQAMKAPRGESDHGGYMAGDVTLTIPGSSPLWYAGQHDLIEMRDSSEPFQLALENAAEDEPPRLPFPVERLERCVWVRASDEALIGAPMPRVAGDGTLSWDAGAVGAPPEGRPFTLTGRRHPTFFVWTELPQDRAHCAGRALPRKLHARRFEFWGRDVPAAG